MQGVGAPEKKWMDFFNDPNAYWDNRHNKRNPRAPDFKHKDDKDTVLWLDSRDTPSCKPSTQATCAVQIICSMHTILGCMPCQILAARHLLQQAQLASWHQHVRSAAC